MRRLRDMLALAVAGLALAATSAAAAEPVPSASQPQGELAPAETPPILKQGETLTAPPADPQPSGGTSPFKEKEDPPPASAPDASASPTASSSTPTFAIPEIPTSSCAVSGVPPILIPIYQAASDTYSLGPQGPSVLAAINGIESAFGTNMGPSSAGAIGWMQFLPSTWDGYGVDANGDGVKDPYNPEDAIFAAASYLSAAGMPADTYGAIFAYNHADWYVADVLANAACYGSLGGGVSGAFALTPQLQVLSCDPTPAWREKVPAEYMTAFEDAATRYDLGPRGVWMLAAIARLESNFGEGMSKEQLDRYGPLGLDGTEWRHYSVDGDEDGNIRHAGAADSAATLAREIWSEGSIRAGVFAHNQADWYVEAALAEADRLAGSCEVESIDWSMALPNAVAAPINWDNLILSNDLELRDLTTGAIDPRIVGLIGAMTQDHQITLSSLRSDHSQYTVDGNVSNHYFGRAMDIAAVDGVSCTDTAADAPCATLGRSLAYLPAPAHPTELIYCFDLDGPGPAFARADHCDHVHAGYDG
ncbi:MAG TPA: lytic murein transglycosylase [Solirubrobacterales bacterium]